MIIVLSVLVAISLAATLATLFIGMLGLTRATPNPRRSNKLMQYRVLLQGVTLLLFAMLIYALRR